MATKLIENINEEIWNKFAGYSKMKGKKVGELLDEVLLDYLRKEGISKDEQPN